MFDMSFVAVMARRLLVNFAEDGHHKFIRQKG